MPIVSMVPMVSIVPICLWSYVKELLGDNHHLYEAFISHTDIDYSTEAQTFFNPFYDIVLGNTMPLPLSTSLQFSIVIFSKDSRTPIMYSRTSELRTPPGNEGVHKSELSITLKSSTSLKILSCSLQFS